MKLGWLALALTAVVTGCADRPDGDSLRPNVMIVTLDTTRADRLGAYGYEEGQTPVLDSLAESGFVFDNHLVPVPITLPSHTSLFSGLYPTEHGVRDNGAFRAGEELKLLAEAFRDAGYDTAAFVGSFPVTAEFGLNQGFGSYDDNFSDESDADLVDIGGARNMFFSERPASAVASAVLSWLDNQWVQDKPFFIWVHVFDPHQPLTPPMPYADVFRGDLYDGEIAFVDAQLGRVFDHLSTLGIDDSTLKVITADHGEAHGEHGEVSHAMLLHQATLKVPLILHGPGIPAGRTDVFTDATQVASTTLQLAGLNEQDHLDPYAGISLLPLVNNGGIAPANYPMLRSYAETLAPKLSHGWNPEFAWTRDGKRLVHATAPRFYDLIDDPSEIRDLYAADLPEAGEWMAELRAFVQATDKGFALMDDTSDIASISTRLAGLGYMMPTSDKLSAQSADQVLAMDENRPGVFERVAEVSQLSSAKLAVTEGKFDLCVALHKDLLEKSPYFVDAWRVQAQCLAAQGDYAKASESAFRAIEIDPSEANYLAAASVQYHFQDYVNVVKTIDEMPNVSSNVPALILKGQSIQHISGSHDAIPWYAKARELGGDNPGVGLFFANAAADLGRVEEARAEYEALLTRNPFHLLATYNYGLLLEAGGNVAAAKSMYERAIAISPGYAKAQESLQQLAIQDGP